MWYTLCYHWQVCSILHSKCIGNIRPRCSDLTGRRFYFQPKISQSVLCVFLVLSMAFSRGLRRQKLNRTAFTKPVLTQTVRLNGNTRSGDEEVRPLDEFKRYRQASFNFVFVTDQRGRFIQPGLPYCLKRLRSAHTNREFSTTTRPPYIRKTQTLKVCRRRG